MLFGANVDEHNTTPARTRNHLTTEGIPNEQRMDGANIRTQDRTVIRRSPARESLQMGRTDSRLRIDRRLRPCSRDSDRHNRSIRGQNGRRVAIGYAPPALVELIEVQALIDDCDRLTLKHRNAFVLCQCAKMLKLREQELMAECVGLD